MQSLAATRKYRMFGESVHTMMKASQELAVMRIQKVRDTAETIQASLVGVQSIFEDVRRAHQEFILTTLREQKKESETRADKRAIVLFSSQQLFSGTIHKEIFELFEREAKAQDATCIIVGAVGKHLAHQSVFFLEHPFTYIDIDLATATIDQFLPLLQQLAGYDQVTIFAGRYQNLMTQSPIMVDATGSRYLEEMPETGSSSQQRHFLFEPTLPELVTYFEQEITRFLVELSISGSRIANLGSEIQTLEQAVSNVEHTLQMINRRERRLKKAINNKKQQQRIAGIGLWG